ncbi:hypothetical protein ACFQZW_12910 [Lutibacter aestuarii]|uniref:Phage protein, HK97 gp10 family n=1 Tax=Lutibacter aestuarii TaxID=861111 RepID=A0ABW2Z9F4_9FLAO
MAKDLYEIKGFDQLQLKLKQLPDKVKKKEINKILGQVANPTLKAAQQLTPKGSGSIEIGSKKFARKKRQVGKTVIATTYTPGYGKKTIAKKAMTRTDNALVYVSPRSRKKADGFYLRQWVIRGTKFFKGNNFIQRAYEQTKGLVTADAEIKITKYIQKQINRLSN